MCGINNLQQVPGYGQPAPGHPPDGGIGAQSGEGPSPGGGGYMEPSAVVSAPSMQWAHSQKSLGKGCGGHGRVLSGWAGLRRAMYSGVR